MYLIIDKYYIMKCLKVVSIYCDELIFFMFLILKINYIYLFFNLVNKKKLIFIIYVNYERYIICRVFKFILLKLINFKLVVD